MVVGSNPDAANVSIMKSQLKSSCNLLLWNTEAYNVQFISCVDDEYVMCMCIGQMNPNIKLCFHRKK